MDSSNISKVLTLDDSAEGEKGEDNADDDDAMCVECSGRVCTVTDPSSSRRYINVHRKLSGACLGADSLRNTP